MITDFANFAAKSTIIYRLLAIKFAVLFINSIILPFDFTIEGSPLEDATIMVLDSGQKAVIK